MIQIRENHLCDVYGGAIWPSCGLLMAAVFVEVAVTAAGYCVRRSGSYSSHGFYIRLLPRPGVAWRRLYCGA